MEYGVVIIIIIFNSNTGPSHTNKKLQEIYFEAPTHQWTVQKIWKRIGDNPTHYCSMWATSSYRVCKEAWWTSGMAGCFIYIQNQKGFNQRHVAHGWSTKPTAIFFNPLTPNDPYSGRTAPLTSERCILYIYSTNTGTEYFKHGIYSPFFSLQNAVCFIILTYLFPVLFTFYIQGVLKFKKIIPAPKGNHSKRSRGPG